MCAWTFDDYEDWVDVIHTGNTGPEPTDETQFYDTLFPNDSLGGGVGLPRKRNNYQIGSLSPLAEAAQHDAIHSLLFTA